MDARQQPAQRNPLPGADACRFCGAPLELTVVDLGKSPLCQSVLRAEQLEQGEAFYPLHVRACERCWLVQIAEFVLPDEIFTEYAYFSAYSDSWVEHARSRAFSGLQVEWDAERGARDLVAGYRAAGLTSEQFEGRSFVRLRQLRHLVDEGALGGDLRWT